ncbi:hypothetical protein [Exiguobacterium flavidum]|uniref:hypothetical protein n=1 Tax=Exiguobacterium flavidum TaxID=2184695 RepID=UPI000DF8525B|nr:hypothetical protein [Exiguobacterium flavidum]
MHFNQALKKIQTIAPEIHEKGEEIATSFYRKLHQKYPEHAVELKYSLEHLEQAIRGLEQLMYRVASQNEPSELFKTILMGEINQNGSFLLRSPEIIREELLNALAEGLSCAQDDDVIVAWSIVHDQLVETCIHFSKSDQGHLHRQRPLLLIAEGENLLPVLEESKYAFETGREITVLHIRRSEEEEYDTSILEGLAEKGAVVHMFSEEVLSLELMNFMQELSSDDPIIFVSGTIAFIDFVRDALEPLPVIFGPFTAEVPLIC